MNTRKGQNTIYMGNNIITPENSLEREFEKMRIEKEVDEANKLYLELEKQKQVEIEAKLATLEMLPMFNKIILLPYPGNPYKKVLQGSIIVDYSGNFTNPDSGEQDTLSELVACAKVVEVGPDVKYLKPGDDVYYDPRSAYPIPFMSLGYRLIHETGVLCVLNDKLKERFNMNTP